MIKNSILIVLLCVFFALALALGLTPGLRAFASEEKTAFEQADVKNELTQMGFNLEEYPKSADGNVALFGFVEYGFSEIRNETDDYGLYFYLYNPQELEFDFDSVKSFIQMGSEYDDRGACVDYDKYQLVLVSSAENGRYLKVKVDELYLPEILELQNTKERRYDISGVELLKKGELNANDYPVSTTFYFTGFAKGFSLDEEAESTLQCRTVELETIQLDVKHTTYKAYNTDNVTGQELATVYFNVPDRYFDQYGALQQIKAEWLYSMTDYIYCTWYRDLYDKLLPYVGKEVVYEEDLPYYLYSSMTSSSDGYQMYWYDAYNIEGNAINNHVVSRISAINWLMPKYINSPEELLSFYKNAEDKDKLLSEVDTEKTVKVIDAGTTIDLKGLYVNHSGWEWLWEALGFTETIAELTPIYIVTDADYNLSNEDFANTLKVNEEDVTSIKAMHAESGSKTVLFRFAVNGFESQKLRVNAVNYSPEGFSSGSIEYLHRIKLPLYQDFDIIWLGFQKEGKMTIIPAVSDPITVIGTTDPPLDNNDKDWSGPAFIDSILPEEWKENWKDILEAIKKYILMAIGVIIGALVLVLILKVVSIFKPKRVKVKVKQSRVKKSKTIKPPKV